MFRLYNRMPLGTRRVIGRAAVGASLAALLLGCDFGTKATHAYPGTSPSARAAARLKYRPPSGWIRHYLGDDRYKIMGGTWKVVSTELDQYYYPPWAPEMLRQPAGIVIGFSSIDEAEAAGYRASNYPMGEPTLKANSAPSASITTIRQGNMTLTLNRGRARRIALIDGVSTVLLPSGWLHMRMNQAIPMEQGVTQAGLDIFVPAVGGVMNSRSPRAVAFGILNVPAGINAEAIFRPEFLSRASAAANRSGRVNNVESNRISSIRNLGAARLGGLGGVRFSMTGVPGVAPNASIVAVARGSKAYYMVNMSRGAPGASAIISSFQPR